MKSFIFLVFVNLLLALIITINTAEAQTKEIQGFEDQQVFSELGGGLILDNTRTKGGRDFYDLVYQKWATAQSDTVEQNLSVLISSIGEELTIKIEEQPSMGTSTIVSITINNNLIWQQFLQPREAVVESLSENAILYITDYVINYKEYVQQLSNEDQQGNGIY